VMLNSRAVFSSGLWAPRGKAGGRSEKGRVYGFIVINVHLPATEDEALLWRRNTRLLLDFLLDPGDLREG
jgi:hypothetical protein